MTHARNPSEGDNSGGSEYPSPWSPDPGHNPYPPPRRPQANPPSGWMDNADTARTGPPEPPGQRWHGYPDQPNPRLGWVDSPYAEQPPASGSYGDHARWRDPAPTAPPPYVPPPSRTPIPYRQSENPPHSHRQPSGGGRSPGRRTGVILACVLVLVAGVAAATTLYITRSEVDGACGDATLRLAVAPEVSPLVAQAVTDLDGSCPSVALTPLAPGETSAVLTAGGLDGWVPASSAWLYVTDTVLQPSVPPGTAQPEPTAPADDTAAPPDPSAPAPAPGGSGLPSGAVSLVRTPLVVAAPQPLAEQFGWPQRQPTWAELAAAVVGGQIPRFTMDSPLRSSAGVLAMLGVHAAMSQTTPDQGIAQMRALTLRSRLADAEADAATLLEQLSQTSDPADAVEEVGAFPVTEQALRTYHNGRPAVPLAALYPGDALMEADYPLVLSPQANGDSERRGAADRLVARIHSAEFAATVAAHGFRPAEAGAPEPPAGTAQANPDGTDAPADPSAPPLPAPADASGLAGLLEDYPAPTAVPADPELVTGRAHQWAGYQQLSFNVLILVDASASMNEPVRDASGNRTTKADLLRTAGTQAAQLFGLDTSVGMWMFATPAPASPPFVEVVPFGPLDEPLDGVARREVVHAVAEEYRAFDRAGTPLYETVLRGITAMQPEVDPAAVTLVVVLTDGRDEDTAYAMPREDFLSRLGQTRDPARPVPVFCIGYGADADMPALTAISEATGGRAVASNNPGDLASAIAQIFLAAHGVH